MGVGPLRPYPLSCHVSPAHDARLPSGSGLKQARFAVLRFRPFAPVHPRCSRRLSASLRTVKFLTTFPCVSFRGMKETGAISRPVPPNHSDIRRAQVLQPPDSRTYSAEVTSFPSNLPHHRRLRPNRRLIMIQQHPRVCQAYFFKKPSYFASFLHFLLVTVFHWPPAPSKCKFFPSAGRFLLPCPRKRNILFLSFFKEDYPWDD